MSGYNRVIIMGNLTRDPEIKQLPSGMMLAEFGMASNETYKNQKGERMSRACFVDVTVWGKLAEVCTRFLFKGNPALVDGTLQFDQWETPDGQKRSKLRIKAENVRFLSTRNKAGDEHHGAAAGVTGQNGTAEGGKDDNMPF